MRLRSLCARWTAAFVVLALAAADGCGQRSEPAAARTDVQQVAAALKQQGVVYDVSETAVLGSIHAEGLRLTGPGLDVELYAVEDEGNLKIAMAAAARLAAERSEAGAGTPVQAYVRRDLFVVVRAEPAEGQVRGAMERIALQ